MPSWDVHFDLRVDSSNLALVSSIAAIRAVARTIRGVPLPPGVQDRLHALNIIRAIRGTTGIEGVEMSEEEVQKVISAPEGEPVPPVHREEGMQGMLFAPEGASAPLAGRKREEREVRNAHALMKFVESHLRAEPNQPLTEQLMREFHRILTEGINYPNNEPGRYRSANVTAGDYHAPDHTAVPGLMTDFTTWLNEGAGRGLDPIVQAIAAHFLLVSIHPFDDGNGRTSRGVESFLLYKAEVNVRGFYSLASYYYEHRDEYVQMLTHVRFVSNPDLTPFVKFALRGLETELEQVHSEVIAEVRVIAFKDFARERIGAGGKLGRKTGERQLTFLLGLVGHEVPVRDLRQNAHPLARLYRGLGQKTLARDLNSLREMGLITSDDGLVRANLEFMERFTADYANSLS